MSETLEELHARAVESVRFQARKTASHMGHDHPIASKAKRELSTGNVRVRGVLQGMPRLWHWRKVCTYYLDAKPALWLGTDGVIYSEAVDWAGNSYFVIAELEHLDLTRLADIERALRKLDPCVISITI